ncbi:MAG: hypothetical protein ACRET3_07485, partial [Burkholderiales bacterium]
APATAVRVGAEREETAPATEPAAGTLAPSAIQAATHLPLSRKFDSAAALRRLTELAAQGGAETQVPGSGRRGILGRLWRYPGWSFFTVAVATASAAAYYIAYHY